MCLVYCQARLADPKNEDTLTFAAPEYGGALACVKPRFPEQLTVSSLTGNYRHSKWVCGANDGNVVKKAVGLPAILELSDAAEMTPIVIYNTSNVYDRS
jgi:hypothetical protein